jgi:YD repeat-containing protein
MAMWKRVSIISGFLVSIISLSHATRYEYDSLGRLAKATYDNNVQIVYTYDDSGNQTRRVISLKPDITNDEVVDALDLVALAAVWLTEPCIHPDWCEAGDLDLSGKVDLKDLASVGAFWFEGLLVVPNVVGMTQADAEAAIAAAGLAVGSVSEDFSETVPEGCIISQDPSPPSPLHPGESVALVISIGPQPPSLTEDFETGDFSAHDWQQAGNAPWVIVSDVRYEGSFAARSGAITHSQTSTLELTLDTAFTRICFYRNVSSESNYDYLRFYIDGVEQDRWSGRQDWAQQTYPITPGQHTFRWSYTKDGSVSSGSDGAWIDSIVLDME